MNLTKMTNEVARLRDQIATKKDALDQLEYAKIPREHADLAVDALIGNHAERGRLSVGHVSEGKPNPYGTERDAFSLFCWLAPQLVRARFSEELDRVYDSAFVMDPATSGQTRLKLESELFDLEVAEERLIVQAEDAGHRINRRGDADPRAILEA